MCAGVCVQPRRGKKKGQQEGGVDAFSMFEESQIQEYKEVRSLFTCL